MIWTNKPPEAPGVYWLREPGKEAAIVEVIVVADGRLFVSANGGEATLVELAAIDPAAEWVGPVDTPIE